MFWAFDGTGLARALNEQSPITEAQARTANNRDNWQQDRVVAHFAYGHFGKLFLKAISLAFASQCFFIVRGHRRITGIYPSIISVPGLWVPLLCGAQAGPRQASPQRAQPLLWSRAQALDSPVAPLPKMAWSEQLTVPEISSTYSST